jgi:hypothetical protein
MLSLACGRRAMKQVYFDILGVLAKKPGISISQVGMELLGSWGSSYTRMMCSELIQMGYLISEPGKHGFKVSLSGPGVQALNSAGE